MRRFFLLLAAAIMAVAAHAQSGSFETATEAIAHMKVGWNLGNTLDAHDGANACPDIVRSETMWGQPLTRPALMTMMRDAGFGAIRIPVTWFPHMDNEGKVDEAWMKRVHEVVDYVINAGLYCIVNVHHDTGAHDNAWVIADNDNYEKTKARYENLWTQIANEFKDYDQHLLFEGYNEMLDKYHSWCFAGFQRPGGYNPDEATAAYKGVIGYAQSFVNAVRATGGNNTQRNLVINTYASANGSGNWNAHLSDVLTELTTPTDVTKNHLAFEVHAYPTLSNGQNEVDDIINKVNTHLLPKGPVILGEWGTSNVDKTPNDYEKSPAAFLEFCKYLIQKAKENNIATFYWMGLSDGSARNLPAFNQAAIAKALIRAYYGSTTGYKFPSTDDVETIYTVNYADEWSEAFLYGDWSRVAQKLSNYKGIRLEMVDDSYAGKLQIKIYGDKTSGDQFKEQLVQLASDSNTTDITFDTSVLGSTFWGITLQTLSGAQTVKVKKATLIKADDSEVALTVTKAWGCEVNAELAPPSGIHSISAMPNRNSYLYNLNGQRISTPKKGIYIQNGRKYIAR